MAILLDKIDAASARLYGFDLLEAVRRSREKDDSKNLLSVLSDAVQTHLTQMADEHDTKTLLASEFERSVSIFEGAVNDIVMIFSLYGYALADAEKAHLLAIRKSLKTLTSYMSVIIGLDDNKYSSDSVKEQIIALHQNQVLYFPEHYKVR